MKRALRFFGDPGRSLRMTALLDGGGRWQVGIAGWDSKAGIARSTRLDGELGMAGLQRS